MPANSQDTATVSTPNCVMAFGRENETAFLRSVTDRSTGKVILEGKEEVPLWRVALGPGGNQVVTSWDMELN